MSSRSGPKGSGPKGLKVERIEPLQVRTEGAICFCGKDDQEIVLRGISLRKGKHDGSDKADDNGDYKDDKHGLVGFKGISA